MTVHRKPWISCDRDGCTGTFIGATDASWPDLQRAARAAGWKVERFTPRGHLAAAGYSTPIVEALAGIVWVPVYRPRWYQDKRRDGAM